jgi:acyl-CoA thioesterase-1
MKQLIAITAAGLLAGCGGEDAPAAAQGNRTGGETGLPAVPQGPQIRILALGDSLFAGYNLPRSDAYPERLEAALRARGINARITNAGVSGDTTAAGLQRLDFVLNGLEQPPELAIVEFGGNDLLRGLPPAQARENLDAIMARLNKEGVPIVLMGLRAPPNLGPEYARAFDPIYPELAAKYEAVLVPLFIAPLVSDRSLVQADQVHPNAAGVQAMVAASVDTVADAVRKLGGEAH